MILKELTEKEFNETRVTVKEVAPGKGCLRYIQHGEILGVYPHIRGFEMSIDVSLESIDGDRVFRPTVRILVKSAIGSWHLPGT